jgi:hypothetical protein
MTERNIAEDRYPTNPRFDEANDPKFEMVGVCHLCANKTRNTTACKAFPDGIPATILVGDFVHDKAYPGDKGVRFVPVVR